MARRRYNFLVPPHSNFGAVTGDRPRATLAPPPGTRSLVVPHSNFGAVTGDRPRAVLAPPGPPRPKPPPIPSGYYDPALDAQLRAAQRGYGDFQQDTALAGTRSAADYGIQTNDIRTAYANQRADYQRNTALLARSFGQLADRQRNQQAQAGILSGGISLLAAQKRRANQAVSQQGLDIGIGRALQAEQRSLGGVGLAYTRGVTDRATGLARAGRENVQFGLDTEAEKAYQAQQAGYVAPKPGGTGGGGSGHGKPGKQAPRGKTGQGLRQGPFSTIPSIGGRGQGAGGRPVNQTVGGRGRVKPAAPRRRRGPVTGRGSL